MLQHARNIAREADIETRPRRWLYAAFVMMALKVAVTLYFDAEMRGAIPKPSYAAIFTLFWVSKMLPIVLVAALAVWSRQIRNRRLFPVFCTFLLAVIPYEIVVAYAMLHGWKGGL